MFECIQRLSYRDKTDENKLKPTTKIHISFRGKTLPMRISILNSVTSTETSDDAFKSDDQVQR